LDKMSENSEESENEQQYMRVPKEHAEIMMGKLVDAGLIDEDAEVRWEGDFVSFPLISLSKGD